MITLPSTRVNKFVVISVNFALVSFITWRYFSSRYRCKKLKGEEQNKVNVAEKCGTPPSVDKSNTIIDQDSTRVDIKKDQKENGVFCGSVGNGGIDQSSEVFKAMTWTRMPLCKCCIRPLNMASADADTSVTEINTAIKSSMLSSSKPLVLMDTHNHIQQRGENDFIDSEKELANFNAQVKVGVSVVLAVSDQEWNFLLAFGAHVVDSSSSYVEPTATTTIGPFYTTPTPSSQSPAPKPAPLLAPAVAPPPSSYCTNIVIGLGIHPWYVQEAQSGWETRLEEYLVRHPSVILGEIGLCKCARNLRGFEGKRKMWPMQQAFFKTQLTIASRTNRPTSVHCVKAYGAMMNIYYEILQERDKLEASTNASKEYGQSSSPTTKNLTVPVASSRPLPPTIALHSYSGTEMQVGEILAFEHANSHDQTFRSCKDFASWANHRAKQLKLASRSVVPCNKEVVVLSTNTTESTPITPSDSKSSQFEIEAVDDESKKSRHMKNDGFKTKNSSRHSSSTTTTIEDNIKNTTFYFGFSYSINVLMGEAKKGEKNREKLLATIRAVPDDRLLVESDEVGDLGTTQVEAESSERIQLIETGSELNGSLTCQNSTAAKQAPPSLNRSLLGTLKALMLVAEAKGWDLQQASCITSENALRFLLALLR